MSITLPFKSADTTDARPREIPSKTMIQVAKGAPKYNKSKMDWKQKESITFVVSNEFKMPKYQTDLGGLHRILMKPSRGTPDWE